MSAIEQFGEENPMALTLYRKPDVEVYVGTHFREATYDFYEATEVTREAFYAMIHEAWKVLCNKRIAAGRAIACALEKTLHAIINGSTATAHFTWNQTQAVYNKALVPGYELLHKTLAAYGTNWKAGFPVMADFTAKPLNWAMNSREIHEAEGRVRRAAKRREHANDVFDAAIENPKIDTVGEESARKTAQLEETREQTAIKSRNAAYAKRGVRVLGVSAASIAATGAAGFLAYNLSVVADAGIFTSVLATVPFALGKYGKRNTDIPLPEVDRSQQRREEPITDTFVVQALCKLPIAELSPENIEPLTPPKELADGHGWTMSLQLLGTTINELKKYHEKLELFLRAPVGGLEIIGDPVRGNGFVVIRVSDLHASQRKAASWPLLELDHLNFFEPLPIGISPMGEIGTISIAGKNIFGCGISDSGKSESWEKLAFSALMDPIVEARFVCGKHINEFGLLADAGTVSIYGDPSEDDQVARDFYELLKHTRSEVRERGKILDARGRGEKKVTEELARSVPGLHPIVIFIDEYHKFKNHKVLGADIQNLMMEIVTQSRFVLIHFLPLVQSITGQGIPTPFVTQHQKKIGFRTGVVDVTALNDGGSHANGMNPSEIPEDLPGTAIISGAQPTTIRFFNPSHEEKTQVAQKIIDMRGGPVKKLDLTPKVQPLAVEEKSTKSKKFPHLLQDIWDMQRPEHKGRLQGLEILPRLPQRPEYTFQTHNDLNYELRRILGSDLVKQINKVAEGGKNSQGIVLNDIRPFISERGEA